MYFETLKSRKRKYFLFVLIVGVLLLLPLVLSITFGKYQTKESIKLVEGTISYKPYDFKIMAMYRENDSGAYSEINSIPTNGYKINEEKSYCTLDNINKDNNAILKTIGNEHSIKNISPNDKCYLYFDKVVISNIEDIINSKTIVRRTDFSTALTKDTTGTIFVAEDDYGISYYYAGAVQDNWIKFAGFYWRIIRINGDGTIRMIYSGSEESGPATTGEATQIGISEFNLNHDNNMYVGYMYTSGQVHGTGTSSRIKGAIDTWYNGNLSVYTAYLATGNGATFCNDRQPSTSSSSLNVSGGTGTTITYYAGYIRLVNGKAPSLKCTHSDDRFSTSIGLISADEVAYAGGIVGVSNFVYYLYTETVAYWTISPAWFQQVDNVLYSCMFVVAGGGDLVYPQTENSYGVRPVINLKADTQFSSGDGTIDTPYVVS